MQSRRQRAAPPAALHRSLTGALPSEPPAGGPRRHHAGGAGRRLLGVPSQKDAVSCAPVSFAAVPGPLPPPRTGWRPGKQPTLAGRPAPRSLPAAAASGAPTSRAASTRRSACCVTIASNTQRRSRRNRSRSRRCRTTRAAAAGRRRPAPCTGRPTRARPATAGRLTWTARCRCRRAASDLRELQIHGPLAACTGRSPPPGATWRAAAAHSLRQAGR